jgi:hypothetical protein
MSTLFRWMITLPVAIAFVSPAVAETASSPQRQPESVVSLFCYMITTDGQVRDLTSLCGGVSEAAPAQVAQTPRPCYFLDSDGRPCPATARANVSN